MQAQKGFQDNQGSLEQRLIYKQSAEKGEIFLTYFFKVKSYPR